MNQQEELVLKILSSVNVIEGKTKFMKILHLVCKFIEKKGGHSPFEFQADKFGVYSPQLQPVLENLESDRYIKIQKGMFSKREDLSLRNTNYSEMDRFSEISPSIKELVWSLNDYSADEIIAISYHFFPDTTVNSKIKTKVNKKITELFSSLNPEFEDSDVYDEKIHTSNDISLYPQYNDLDIRKKMMDSLGLADLPQIDPAIIDDSTGILASKTTFFKKYNLEELLEDARRR